MKLSLIIKTVPHCIKRASLWHLNEQRNLVIIRSTVLLGKKIHVHFSTTLFYYFNQVFSSTGLHIKSKCVWPSIVMLHINRIAWNYWWSNKNPFIQILKNVSVGQKQIAKLRQNGFLQGFLGPLTIFFKMNPISSNQS